MWRFLSPVLSYIIGVCSEGVGSPGNYVIRSFSLGDPRMTAVLLLSEVGVKIWGTESPSIYLGRRTLGDQLGGEQ